MATINIATYTGDQSPFVIAEFEEAIKHSALSYSMRHLILAGLATEENFDQMLSRSMQVCRFAGIRISDHFRQIFVFDQDTGATYFDWLMTREGFKLMLMQNPGLNERLARYLWELVQQ